jgi:hypothetical protein
MESPLLPTVMPLARFEDGQVRIDAEARDEVRGAVLAFLDVAATATGQETYYNTQAEQRAATDTVQGAVFRVNRGLYAALLALPGVTDHNIQKGILRLLDNPAVADGTSFLTPEQENRAIDCLARALPPQRLFKLFGLIRQARVNNRRTRRLILRSVLGSPKLPLWAVKYRLKLRSALRHALGGGLAGRLRNLTSRSDGPTPPELCAFDKYLPADADRDQVYQCLCFILGGERDYTLPLLAARRAARADLERGACLPVEVLEGIRGRFHKDVPPARVLELAKGAGTLTDGQKLARQRSAQRRDVELAFDPSKADLVRLYVYALECGMTAEVREALDAKARRVVGGFPPALRYERVGVVVDTSESMAGTGQGKYRPLAVALALRDILAATARHQAVVRATAGVFDEGGLARPQGETSLAEALLDVIGQGPDALYLLTDGYENAPSGRVDEVIRALRGLGVATPVYQVTPVLAGETGGVRSLSGLLAPIPVSRPEGLPLALVRAALTQDIEKGIQGLLELTKPRLLEDKA